ncbi:hypothetical protein AGOR_G00103740 [Albula goreensis]|uniref:Triacylglycerol lipase n=1 Tax=Albula goreensis TaxID=1534307 RepID=A0A8T3DJI1_9TELE|nr:hypothetical protein AGOR_G00103740 [Albula goreensis]
MIMGITGRVLLHGLLVALSVSLPRSGGSLTNSLPNDALTLGSEKTESLLSLLCAQPSLSPSPPSSVHALRPSDIAVVSAVGMLHSHRTEKSRVLGTLSELLSMFNPALTQILPEQTSTSSSQYRSLSEQAEALAHRLKAAGHDKDWKLLLLFIPVDEMCVCPELVSTAIADTVQQVKETLQILHRQIQHTLVSAVVWAGLSDEVRDSHHDSICHCMRDYSTAKLRLMRTVLAQALQESLEHHLEERQWYSDREDFTVQLQPTPMILDYTFKGESSVPNTRMTADDIDHVTIELWRNLLQPMRGQSDMKGNDIISTPCPSEDHPFLRTQRNVPSDLRTLWMQRAASPRLDPVMGTELPCEDRSPSNFPPTSVHALRPGDIKVVAAVGDSLTAANGVGATNTNNILDVIREYRGLSWCIGGDHNLTGVTTLPNILREFNPFLTGFSEGIADENSPKAYLNQAVPGANSDDMPAQVRRLVDKMKNDTRIDFQNDWKVITMFIGGNDLCDYCTDTIYFSPENIVSRIREALDILHNEVPRALVNLVELMHIVPLRRLHQDSSLKCPTWLVNIMCRCVVSPKEGSAELQSLTNLNRAYQRGVQDLVESGRYDTHSNFTVVLQPFFREVVLPLLDDGRPDRSYFAPDCFHLSQKSHTLMARALWNNMLEPVGNKTHTQDFTAGLSMKCPSKAMPFFRTYENSNYTYQGPAPTPPPATNWGSEFSCRDLAPSNSVPTSVHRLRPADIKVVAAVGDSISAGFGAKSKNLLQLKNEYRGVSWSIGGDKTLQEVTTLPNILKNFNPSLRGFSLNVGTGQRGFNMAVSGAKAAAIPGQVKNLIQAMRDSKDVDFENDWKLVTMFIGGNDLCQYCLNRAALSPQNYSYHLRESLDLLYQEVPRVMVNMVEILQIAGLRRIKRDTLGCSLLQQNVCPCFLVPAEDSLELSEINRVNRLYQEETERLVNGGRYDGREDFTVVIQPYFRNSIVPLSSDQKPDLSFFSVDCFHFSERGHSEMAIALWNNMLEPVGRKQVYNNFTHDRNKIQCPTQDQPYIFTRINSYPSIPTQAPITTQTTPRTISAATITTATPVTHNSDSVPIWGAALLGVTGLLIGWGVTWLLLSCRERRQKKKLENVVEMKGTGF